MRIIPLVFPDQAGAELRPRLFWIFHVPLVLAFVGLVWFLRVRGLSRISPGIIAGCAFAHLAIYGTCVHTYRPNLWGRILYTVVPIVNLTAIGVITASTRQPSTPLWGMLVLYAVVLSQAFGQVITLIPAVPAVPLVVAAIWSSTGAVPFHDSAGPIVMTALVALFCYLVLARLRDETAGARDRLKLLEQEVAIEGERRRIARDMHDTLGSTLTEISLWLGIELERRSDPTQGPLARAERRAREALTELRACLGSLDGGPVTPAAFLAILRKRLQAICDAASVELILEVGVERANLDGGVAFHLLRLLHEAATNALRHGKPRTLEVRVALGDCIEARVDDDGGGFPTESSLPGRGLAAMRERAAKLGLHLDIESRPGAGTSVRIGTGNPAAPRRAIAGGLA